MDSQRIRARDAALIRLRRLTTAAAAGAGALALGLTGLAAKAFPGRSSHTASTTTVRSTPRPVTRAATQTPPPLVSAGSQAQSQAPSVAVSGGS